MAQHQGIVKWFDSGKGYGFLGCEGRSDTFVHYSAIQMDGYKRLREGDTVSFNIIQGTGGPQADQVNLCSNMRATSSQQGPATT